jgi:hypothetical protein
LDDIIPFVLADSVGMLCQFTNKTALHLLFNVHPKLRPTKWEPTLLMVFAIP